MASWLHGFTASRFHGFMVSWFHGFMASWLNEVVYHMHDCPQPLSLVPLTESRTEQSAMRKEERGRGKRKEERSRMKEGKEERGRMKGKREGGQRDKVPQSCQSSSRQPVFRPSVLPPDAILRRGVESGGQELNSALKSLSGTSSYKCMYRYLSHYRLLVRRSSTCDLLKLSHSLDFCLAANNNGARIWRTSS